MAARFLQFALWLALVKWTRRILVGFLVAMLVVFFGVTCVALGEGQKPGHAVLTALITTVILFLMPFKWMATGQMPAADL